MNKKFLSAVVAAVMLISGAAAIAASDNSAQLQNEAAASSFYKRTDVTVSSISGSTIYGMNEEEEFSVSVSSDTLYLDNDGNRASFSDIKEDDFIYIYEKNGRVAVIVISSDDSVNSVDIDRYEETDSDLGILINQSGTLILTSANNAFDLYGNSAEDLAGRDLAVFFKLTERTSPETTRPEKIIVLDLSSSYSDIDEEDAVSGSGDPKNDSSNTKTEVSDTESSDSEEASDRSDEALSEVSIPAPEATSQPVSENKAAQTDNGASSHKTASKTPIGTAAPEKTPVPNDGTIKVIVNGEYIDFSKYDNVLPKIENDRTLIPIRAVIEGLGAQIDWDSETRTIEINKNGIEITLMIDSTSALVNGAVAYLDAAPKIENDRTLVPLRFISENLGSKVDWDEETTTVIITD